MAFNPFHQFRRHNKKIFAVLAIVCMFVFVVSSGMGGRGDLFTQIGDWLSGSGAEKALISIAGRNYDAREVDQILIQRRLASEYMDAAVNFAQANIIQRVSAGVDKLDQRSRDVAEQIVGMKRLAQMAPQFAQQYVNIIRNAQSYDSFLVNLIATAQRENRADDVNTLTGVRAILLHDYRQLNRQSNEGFFGGPVRERDYQSIADFLMWLHQADQLGIQFTQGDVQQAIAVETLYELRPENAAQINKGLRANYSGYNLDTLYAALGDELRVQAAQASFLSTASSSVRTRTASPSVQTPDQLWDMFKDARTTIRAGLITVPVEPFVAQVTEKPTDAELKKLFDQHKNEEPMPFLERPGFKEPRRVQVEWVNGKSSAPFYQKAAADLLPVFQAMRLLGIANSAEAAAAPLALDGELLDAQREYLRSERPWTESFFTNPIHDTSIVTPQNIKSLIGSTVGALGTGATILSGPLGFEGSVVATEALERARLGMAMFGFGWNDAYGSAVAALALTPQSLGLEVLRQPLREKTTQALAGKLLESDLVAFRNKVIELGREKDKTALRKTVDEFIAQRGMYRGATTELRDRFDMANDAGMARLKEIYLKAHSSDDPLGLGFGATFFLDPSHLGGVSTFAPQEFMAPADDGKFVFWLTEDREARVPRFEKALPQVELAWKFQKARDKAKAEADRLLVEVKQAQGDVPKLRDLAVQNGDRAFFELGPLALRMPVPSVVAGAARQYQAPTIPQDRIAFPSNEFINGLLDLRKEPRGSAVVLADMPKAHFYVTSLIFRDEPTQEEFRRAYVGMMANAVERDYLLPELAIDARVKFQRETIQQLRELSKVKVNPDALKSQADSEPPG